MDETKSTNDGGTNRDPITGEPGSHPIGTGVGTAGGGLTGAAIGGAVGGPIGAAIGAIVGGIAGAAGGHEVAEAVNPTVEDAYWRENHGSQSYATGDSTYDHYAPAYRTGYEGAGKHAGKAFEDVENDLAADFHKAGAQAEMTWDRAKPAARAAWDRVAGTVAPRDTDRGTRGNL